MALTLAEAKVGYADKVDQQVIDEFRRDSVLLDMLTFDDTISPTGGSNLVYGYERLETPSTAGVRQINEESVEPIDRLSDNVYEFDGRNLKIAGTITEEREKLPGISRESRHIR